MNYTSRSINSLENLQCDYDRWMFLFQTIYFAIVVFLLSTGLYDYHPKNSSAFDYGTVTSNVDLEGFKVLSSIVAHFLCAICLVLGMIGNDNVGFAKIVTIKVMIAILLFTCILNIGGCACLWIHCLPNFPGGFSTSIKATAILSTVALVYTFVTVLTYIFTPPRQFLLHEAIRSRSLEKEDLLEETRDHGNERVSEQLTEDKLNEDEPSPIPIPSPVAAPAPAPPAVPPVADQNYLPLVPPPPPKRNPIAVQDADKSEKKINASANDDVDAPPEKELPLDQTLAKEENK